MDKVLIVDSNKDHLKRIESGFKELHHFKLLTASDGKTAIDILQQTKIAVFVTDSDLPDIDGVELLAFMTRTFRTIPCVVMLEPGKPKPWFSDRSGHEDLLYYLEKPFEFGELASIIFVGQNLKDEGLNMKGMTLKNFLPLMALTRKTCQMEIVSGKKKQGTMFFKEGVLLDAFCNGNEGDSAAKEMAGWESVSISFKKLPDKDHQQKVHTKLMEISGAIWKKKSKKKAAPKKGKKPAKTQQLSKSSTQAPPKIPGQSDLQASVSRYTSMLKTIKGYRGFAVLSPDGKILAMDRNDDLLDLEAFTSDFNTLFAQCSKTVTQKGLDKCTGFSIHTPKGIIIMMTSDVYKHGNYRFIGILSPEGNGYFMQTQLAKAIPQILGGV